MLTISLQPDKQKRGGETRPIFNQCITEGGESVKKKRKNKRESGQAMLEFALVLPLFLLLIMGIIDFGFLFYNYIGMENAARNAARIACVEYDDCCTMEVTEGGNKLTKPVTGDNATFTLKDFFDESGNLIEEGSTFSEEERHIALVVKDSLPTGVKANFDSVTFKINYSYDTSLDTQTNGFFVEKRYTGDVVVTVSGDANVLTPVLGVTADDMKRALTTSSTFKVEKQYTEAS